MSLWPQYVALVYLLFAVIAGAHKGSQKYSFGVNVLGELTAVALVLWVLWAGGFFAPMGFAP